MNNEIAIAPQSSLIPSEKEWTMLKEQATMLAKEAGEFLPRQVNTPGKVLAIALVSRELGIPIMQGLSSIHIVEGKPTMASEQMLAMIYERCKGAKIDFKQMTDKGCTIVASRPGQKEKEFSFTEDDAKRANLLHKDNWKKYPVDMFKNRAVSRMGRTMFPDILRGVIYTPEEIEYIEVTPNKATEIVEAIEAVKPKEIEEPKQEVLEPVKEEVSEEKKEQIARDELSKLILKNWKDLGFKPAELTKEIDSRFNKKAKDLTMDEMFQFNRELVSKLTIKE